MLWTRRPYAAGVAARTLHVEVAEDRAFGRVVVSATARVSAESDWTYRVLVGGLMPARVYWYRFTDSEGNGSRVGRTRTAPAEGDDRAVRFAFVSCQDVNEGKLNASRRMIEDERTAPADRIPRRSEDTVRPYDSRGREHPRWRTIKVVLNTSYPDIKAKEHSGGQ